MCFSAEANFTVGTIIGVMGFATLFKLKGKHLIPLALIPVFFMFQQFAEGFVWVFMPYEKSAAAEFAKFVYLFFALSFWPAFLPFAVAYAESDPIRKKLSYILFAIGLAVAAWDLYGIVTDPLEPHIVGKSLAYGNSSMTQHVIYGSISMTPLLLSSLRGMNILGLLGIVFFIISEVFYHQAFISVWCFFAAALSFALYFVIGWASEDYQER